MTVQNAFIIFLLAFSSITGWLMFRVPAAITVVDKDSETTQKSQPTKIATTTVPQVSNPEPQSIIHTRLDNTVLPLLDLSNVTLEEAISFLQFRARELSTVQGDSTNSLYIVIAPEILTKSVTNSNELLLFSVYAENINLADALDLICEKANCAWSADEYQVIITTK